MLLPPYAKVLSDLSALFPASRLITDPLRTLAYGTDASFYRLIPKIVVFVEDEAEVRHLLSIAGRYGTPVTFRAAGTSLSGQAVSDSILAVLGDGWRDVHMGPDGLHITLQPGVIGAEANRHLAPHGRRIGPDPASIATARIGGIAANNASGMCCGTAQNSYRTLRSMRLILADGTLLDTGDPASRATFTRTHAGLLATLAELGRQTRDDAALSRRITEKFRIKNTTGYSLNALVDHDDPIDILQHLMIGSEGTLGFIAGITLDTVPDPAHKATALLLFADIAAACRAVTALRDGPVAAVELMDRAALRSVSGKPGMPPGLDGLPVGAAALLVECRAEAADLLETALADLDGRLAGLDLLHPGGFSRDPATGEALWKLRKGLFPAVGAVRRPGTTVIIEDVAFPLDRLAAATLDLQDCLARHGYGEAIIFGHALAGNLHFVFTQDFGPAAEVARYAAFMTDVADLVVRRHDGSLKAEHGTGRNMAPFVELEWGRQATDLMRRIKRLLDPEGLLNPGVILNDDSEIHLKHLKPLPAADGLVDKCIECGFCEPVCPSHGLTLSPRQRIVGARELARGRAAGEDMTLLARLYDYQAVDSCAACGLCATRCPVEIETGLLMKQERGYRRGRLAHAAGRLVGAHMHPVLGLTRLGLALARPVAVRRLAAWARHLSGGLLPRMPDAMPRPVAPPTTGAPDPADFLYIPSCVSRSLGPAPGEPDGRSLPEILFSIAAKAGLRLALPPGLDGMCCGMPLESKGLAVEADAMADRLLAAAAGRPVLMDTSPCAFRLKRRLLAGGVLVLDLAEFLHDHALPRLRLTKQAGPVMLHITCSSRRMGLDARLRAVALACAEQVVIPADVGCCGFAGDKGFTLPALNDYALRFLREAVPEGCAEGYSTSRTCEIGLAGHAGISYRSLAYLVDRCAAG